jgi:hypothetical protein
VSNALEVNSSKRDSIADIDMLSLFVSLSLEDRGYRLIRHEAGMLWMKHEAHGRSFIIGSEVKIVIRGSQ